MKSSLNVIKNTFSLIIREALNKGALFILLVFIGRLLGKEALGRYSLAIGISQIFFFGTELGLNTLLIREVARERQLAGKFLVNIRVLRILSGLLTMVLIWATASGIGAKGETAVVIYLCGISYFFVNITNLYTSIFRAFERMELDLLTALIRNITFFPLAMWVLFNELGLVVLFNVFLISNVLTLIIAHFVFIRQIALPLPLRVDFSFWKEQLLQTSPLGFSQLFGIAYLRIAPLLLFKLKGEGAVGLYNAGFAVLDGFWVLAGCFVYSVFPMLSRLGRLEARKEYLAGLKVILLFFSVSAALIILTTKGLILLFYGERFLEIAPLFRIFALIAIIAALDMHMGLTMIARGKQFALPLINGTGLMANLLFNILLIPRFGYIGSAYALAASECIVFILMMGLLRKAI